MTPPPIRTRIKTETSIQTKIDKKTRETRIKIIIRVNLIFQAKVVGAVGTR